MDEHIPWSRTFSIASRQSASKGEFLPFYPEVRSLPPFLVVLYLLTAGVVVEKNQTKDDCKTLYENSPYCVEGLKGLSTRNRQIGFFLKFFNNLV